MDLESEISVGLELESSYAYHCITPVLELASRNTPSTPSPVSPPLPMLHGAIRSLCHTCTGSVAQNWRPWLCSILWASTAPLQNGVAGALPSSPTGSRS